MNLTYKIKKSRDCVFGYLTNMQTFVTVHPVITKIDEKPDGSYLVHESLKLGFIPVSFTYPVTIFSYPLDNIVVMRATVMGITKIEMIFSLKPLGEYTLVNEKIALSAPIPIKAVLKRVFKKQHIQLFKNIQDAIA